MHVRLLGLLSALAVAPAAGAAPRAQIPVPDPIVGAWRVASTGTDVSPTVYGSIRVSGGPDDFVGVTEQRTFYLGDAACALAAGKRVWTLRRVGLEGGSATRIRYEGTSVQPYGDSTIGCPETTFDAWWIVSLTEGRMDFSMPRWNRGHVLQRIDTTPPRADAQAGSVAPGRASSLNFAAAEDSGWAHFTVRVLRGSDVLVRRSYGHVFSTSSGETQTIMWKPPRSVRGPLRLCVSAVDGSGNRSSETCAPVTVRGQDRQGPRVHAYSAAGGPTEQIRLRWRMGDDSGTLRTTITVERGGAVIARKTYPAISAQLPGELHWLWYTPPANPASRYTFCVTVRDAAGHRARDCAPLRIQ